MPHCAPGKRFVTAAAIKCAVLWRKSGNASALSGVTTRTEASPVNGNVRSTSLPFTTAATAALARRGEICAAMSAGVDPAAIRRLEPSGSVTEISDIVSYGEAAVASLRWVRKQARAKVGRHERTRTADLLRVKQA